jgi:hypothetical protein
MPGVVHLDLAIAALLHDVGKLYQRAYWGRVPEGLADWSHPAYTEWAIRRQRGLFEGAGLEPDRLASTAARHRMAFASGLCSFGCGPNAIDRARWDNTLFSCFLKRTEPVEGLGKGFTGVPTLACARVGWYKETRIDPSSGR